MRRDLLFYFISFFLAASIQFILFYFDDLFHHEEFMIAFSFVTGLSLPIAWLYLIFPDSILYYRKVDNTYKTIQTVFYSIKYIFSYLILSGFIYGILDKFNFTHLSIYLLQLVITYVFFIGIGERSQAYRTGKKGNSARNLAKETGSISVPIGAIPSLYATLLSVITNVVIALTFLTGFKSTYLYISSGLILISIFHLITFRGNLLKTFYADHGFFSEYFSVSGKKLIIPLREYHSLYWIPTNLRTDLRFLMTEMQRTSSTASIILLLAVILVILEVTQLFRAEHILSLILFTILVEGIQFSSKFLHKRNSIFQFNIVTHLKYHFFFSIRWLPLVIGMIWLLYDIPIIEILLVSSLSILLLILFESIISLIIFKRNHV